MNKALDDTLSRPHRHIHRHYQMARPTSGPWTAFPSISVLENSWPCWDLPDPASPRCSTSLPVSTALPPVMWWYKATTSPRSPASNSPSTAFALSGWCSNRQSHFEHVAFGKCGTSPSVREVDRDGVPHLPASLWKGRLKCAPEHRPAELSGGEQQRASLARALINQPRLLLADEPTGNLDSRTGTEIMQLIQTFNQSFGMTIVMVTHEHVLAERYAGRMLHLLMDVSC